MTSDTPSKEAVEAAQQYKLRLRDWGESDDDLPLALDAFAAAAVQREREQAPLDELAALNKGREEMRERCAQIAESYYTRRRIRALPLDPPAETPKLKP